MERQLNRKNPIWNPFAFNPRNHVIVMLLFIITARLHIQYPMLFKLTNKKKSRETHCGVLEFVADEGRIYIPYWVRAKNIQIHKHHGKLLWLFYYIKYTFVYSTRP